MEGDVTTIGSRCERVTASVENPSNTLTSDYFHFQKFWTTTSLLMLWYVLKLCNWRTDFVFVSKISWWHNLETVWEWEEMRKVVKLLLHPAICGLRHRTAKLEYLQSALQIYIIGTNSLWIGKESSTESVLQFLQWFHHHQPRDHFIISEMCLMG